MTDLTVSVLITTPAASTMELNADPYRAEASSRSTQQTAWRKVMATNPYVEGSYPVSAVKDNIVEQLSVYVTGSTSADLRAKLEALKACLDQLSYSIAWSVGGDVEYWKCFTAEYSMESSQPLQVARKALLKAQVPRLPTLGSSL